MSSSRKQFPLTGCITLIRPLRTKLFGCSAVISHDPSRPAPDWAYRHYLVEAEPEAPATCTGHSFRLAAGCGRDCSTAHGGELAPERERLPDLYRETAPWWEAPLPVSAESW
ncbi:hypothetical protein BN6_51870 [Saccharothrix espanaensis DSM 44229]|uniref:Uncharacterized protein n=1 Tax=Saccharothrix espanaensis (strain ATCC 51144 / DSM 44229 / JCM 9112 / NBRC 15066 / NRRL 15764) TaxID=1179773 RepID=K0K774_SACES|nr:hypothetical protein BN6_51870 [Saccharothrix espanaensis DSM 44229]